jgi:hypothetical protein
MWSPYKVLLKSLALRSNHDIETSVTASLPEPARGRRGTPRAQIRGVLGAGSENMPKNMAE